MTMLDTTGNIKPLVERLRQACQEGREIIEPWQLDPHLYDEAADEIERLRDDLAETSRLLTVALELRAAAHEEKPMRN